MKVLDQLSARTLSEVRLVGEGLNAIMPGLDAWRKAFEVGLDLVQVSDDGMEPIVVRIQDFNKIMFEKKKSKQVQKKKRRSELKEIQLKANISPHDLETKVRNIDKFLERGDKVKVVVRLKGRERDHPERASELMDRLVQQVKAPNRFTKLAGPITSGILEPGK